MIIYSILKFNTTTVTHEKIYDLDADKNRSGIKKDFTGVSFSIINLQIL